MTVLIGCMRKGGINWDVQDLADGSEWYLEDLDADYNYLLKILGDTVGMIQLESKISKLKNDLKIDLYIHKLATQAGSSNKGLCIGS